jgi:hypothetical protein
MMNTNFKYYLSRGKSSGDLKAVMHDLLEDWRLIVQSRFARPSDPESYAGGSVSSW